MNATLVHGRKVGPTHPAALTADSESYPQGAINNSGVLRFLPRVAVELDTAEYIF